jgi:hypothetical protein
METQTADLLIIVRKGSGKLVQPTVGGLPTNNRPVVAEASDTDIRVGAQQGHPLPQDGPASGQTLRSRKELSPTRKRMSARPTTCLSSIKVMWTVP